MFTSSGDSFCSCFPRTVASARPAIPAPLRMQVSVLVRPVTLRRNHHIATRNLGFAFAAVAPMIRDGRTQATWYAEGHRGNVWRIASASLSLSSCLWGKAQRSWIADGCFCRVRGELFSLDDIRAPCSMKPTQADREVQGDLTRAVLGFFGRPKIHRCLGTLTNTRRCAQTRRAVRKTSVASCVLAFACNPPRELQEVSAFTRHHRIALRSHGGARTGMVPPSMFR